MPPPVQQQRDDTTEPDLMALWFNASVWCTDEHFGTMIGIVCSTGSLRTHDIVVRDSNHHHREHPVAVRRITHSGRREITVDLTSAHARDRRFHTETILLTDSPVWWADDEETPDWWKAAHQPLQVPVAVPLLQSGDVLVRSHATVYLDGQHVGHLAGVRTSRSAAEITGIIVDVGHRWHHRHVLLPATTLDELTESMITAHGATPRDLRRHATPEAPGGAEPLLGDEPQSTTTS